MVVYVSVHRIVAERAHGRIRYPTPNRCGRTPSGKGCSPRNGTFGAAVLYPFLVAALPEEIRYRALVLLAQRAVVALTPLRPVRVLVVAAAAGLSIAVFAAAHAEFGAMNMVPSVTDGAIYTGLVIYTRSLWPAIFCHRFYDLVAISRTIL